MSLNIVITMAGKGSRFINAGYKIPKYEIVAHGKTLFEWSLKSLENFYSKDTTFIFITLKETNSFIFINEKCKLLGINNFKVIELSSLSEGQASSALEARKFWDKDKPLLIYNIDTFVNPTELKEIFIRENSDGWIPCFKPKGSHWSFVKINKDNWVYDIKEKEKISDFATIGLYWFAKAIYYEHCYESFFGKNNNLVNGEKYIAPMYKQMIIEGKKISILNIKSNNVHVLGTPEELNKFIANKKIKIFNF